MAQSTSIRQESDSRPSTWKRVKPRLYAGSGTVLAPVLLKALIFTNAMDGIICSSPKEAPN